MEHHCKNSDSGTLELYLLVERLRFVREVLRPGAPIPLRRQPIRAGGQFYLHLDLDALDSAEARANTYAVAGGFKRADLVALLSRIAGSVRMSALTVSAFDPSCDETETIKETVFAAIAAVLDAKSDATYSPSMIRVDGKIPQLASSTFERYAHGVNPRRIRKKRSKALKRVRG